MNPTGTSTKPPDLGFKVKLARTIAPGLSIGPEYSGEPGRIDHLLPVSLQSHRIYAAFDYEHEGYSLNFGVGRGLTEGSDKLTIKAVLGVPLH